MTALLLIGLVPAGTDCPADCPGHGRHPAPGALALTLAADPAEATTEAGVLDWAARQNAVLSAYSAASDVLPLPLGTLFADEAGLAAHLARHHETLLSDLARLAGLCEYGLLVRADEAPATSTPTATGGAAYLRARSRARDVRRSHGTAQQEAIDGILATLSRSAAELRTFPRKDGRRLLDVAVLVARPAVPAMIDGLRSAAARSDGLGLRCELIGPSPAYSFTGAGEADG